jgi:hypothetical protein
MFVRPASPELKIPIPGAPFAARFLPPEGAVVPEDEYWRRRVAEGDVVLADPPAEPPAAKAKKE